jgi:hypothetical protein
MTANPSISDLERRPRNAAPMSADATQVAGSHYKSLAIQPWNYTAANNLNWFEGEIVKYITRWPNKGGVDDLRKARHIIDKLIELNVKEGEPAPAEGPSSSTEHSTLGAAVQLSNSLAASLDICVCLQQSVIDKPARLQVAARTLLKHVEGNLLMAVRDIHELRNVIREDSAHE